MSGFLGLLVAQNSPKTVDKIKIIEAWKEHRILELSQENDQSFTPPVQGWYLQLHSSYPQFHLQIEDHIIMYQGKQPHSSTQLLNWWREDGVRIVDHLEGSFLLVISNPQTRETYLFRDRLGVQPLYFLHTPQMMGWSTLLKPLVGLVPPRLNPEALSSYLTFRYPIQDLTFYEHLHQVIPGHYARFRWGEPIEQIKYWDPRQSSLPIWEEEQVLPQTQKLLQTTIQKYQSWTDPSSNASFLSSGLDSRYLVACLAPSAEKDRSLPTYTVGMQSENEFTATQEVVEKMQERFHLQPHQHLVTIPEYLEAMIKLIEIQGQPLQVPNEVLLYRLSQEIRQNHQTTVWSGEGIDELFHGYPQIFSLEEKFKKQIIIPNFSDFLLEQYSYLKSGLQRHLFSQLGQEGLQRVTQRVQEGMKEVQDLPPQDQTSYFFLQFHLPGSLQRLQHATESQGLQTRVPFTDHHLVTQIFNQVPHHRKLDLTSSSPLGKQLFRELLQKEGLDYHPQQKKASFGVPFTRISEQFTEIYRHILNRGVINSIEHLDINWLKNQPIESDYFIWYVLNIEIFARLFLFHQTKEQVTNFIMETPTMAPRKIIGYTTGVYDMFHVGHINLLKTARTLCDHLIVGVTTDEKVKYKGKSPMISCEDRMRIIAETRYADTVIPQHDHDKFEAWKKLKYDILFVGDDWYGHEKWQQYEAKLSEKGVKIIYLPYTRSISTTSLKKKLQDVLQAETPK